MRMARKGAGFVAAWLGILALSLYALIPIYFAFDLADAYYTGSVDDIGRPDRGHNVLAALVGHQRAGGKADGHSDRRVNCAVCGSLCALAGYAPADGVTLLIPGLMDAAATPANSRSIVSHASPAAYYSRAPPRA